MLAKGWIRPSVSPYGALILFVHKKMGDLRMRVNFRALNSMTHLDVFPVLHISDLLDKLGRT